MSETYPIAGSGRAMQSDITWKSPEESIQSPPEKAYNKFFSNSVTSNKIKQFKAGKYSEKYIKTYLEFILMEGMIDNLQYLEYLKEIGEKV